ncbi:MAG: glycosyltransferase family A protein [Pseudomonadota bacterium]
MAQPLPKAHSLTLSIIIPVWNRAASIGACLSSIKGAEDRDDWEIVLVDDGSTDDSVAQIHASLQTLGLTARATVLEQENAGPGAARNTAIEVAKGDWIVCLDSDDLWLPWTLETLLEFLEEHPETDVAFLRQMDHPQDAPVPTLSREPLQSQGFTGFLEGYMSNQFGVTVSTHNLLCRRSTFHAAGGFQTDLRVFEDSDFFLRLPPEAHIRTVRAPMLVVYHLDTPDSLTKSHEGVMKGLTFMRQAHARGEYPGGQNRIAIRRIFLARVAQFAITNAWQNRQYATSYILFLKSVWELANNRCRLFILRYHQRILKDAFSSVKGAFSRG